MILPAYLIPGCNMGNGIRNVGIIICVVIILYQETCLVPCTPMFDNIFLSFK